MESIQRLLEITVEVSMLIFEFTGVVVILTTGIIGLINFLRRDAHTRLKIANGFATGLEFKLGGEILRTVLVRNINEIIIVGSIIMLRAALSFLIFWEIRNEETAIKEQKEEEIQLEELRREDTLREDLLRWEQFLKNNTPPQEDEEHCTF